MHTYVRWMLYATVFVTGAAVLVIEVAAVRMLSPYYGSSLYVFSSVLTIILGALSVGYYIGGKLSDRFPFSEPLYVIITVSGITTLMMELGSLYVLPTGSTLFSFLSGPLILGFVLFFIPAFLLGIVSPYVIKLQSVSTRAEEGGSVVGMTFFWGTMGSIVGSLLTGFVLIPMLGIKTSMIGTGIVLIALGVVAGLFVNAHAEPGKNISMYTLISRNRRYLFVVMLLTVILAALTLRDFPSSFPNTLYEADGLYSKIIVYEVPLQGERVRILKNDTNHSSATILDSYNLVFGYTQFAEFYRMLKPDTERFLLLGGGAYSIPRTLLARDESIQVDVAEFDPRLFSLAKEYFDLEDSPRMRNFVTDARVFLNQGTTTYDVIFGDAFGTDLSIPAHLTTREFFETLSSRLTPNGILLLNYIGEVEGDTPSLTGSLYKTLALVFPEIKMYAFNLEEPYRRQNIMFIARNGNEPIVLNPDIRLINYARHLRLGDMEVSPSTFSLQDELVLTDDHAPVEVLMLKQL